MSLLTSVSLKSDHPGSEASMSMERNGKEEPGDPPPDPDLITEFEFAQGPYSSFVLEEENEESLPIPPDGGWGWMVVLASFMANLIVDGISYSFGIFLSEFQSYYRSTKGVAAMIGSLLTGCYLIAGPVVSGLVNRYGSRRVMMVGSFIAMGAFFVSVWAPTVTILMIFYGVVGGLGFGLIYLPAIVHVGYYFEKRRAFATGIAVAGSGVGTFVFAPLSVVLLDEYGWKGSLWIMAGLIFNCAVCGALLRPIKPRKTGRYVVRDKGSRRILTSLSSLDVNRNGSILSLDPKAVLKFNVATKTPPPSSNSPTPQNVTATPRGPESSDSGEQKPMLPPVPATQQYEHSTGPGTRDRSVTISAGVKIMGNGMPSKSPRYRSRNRLGNVRTNAYSIGHLSSLPEINRINPSKSVCAIATVDPVDFQKPLYRKDIFYGGSIARLPEYQETQGDMEAYRESMMSIPQHFRIIDGCSLEQISEADAEASGCGSLIPASVKHTVLEMAGLGLLKNPAMLLLCLSNIAGMLGFYCPFVFLTEKAGMIGVSPKNASFLLSIIGITNTLGRVFFGWLSDQGWISALAINNMCLLASATLTALVPFFTSYALMVFYSAVFGFIVSSYISLTSIILVDYLGLENLTNGFGLLILSRGLAVMAGSPVAGLVYDYTNSYDASFYYSGGMLMVAGFISCCVPLVTRFRDIAKFFRRRNPHSYEPSSQKYTATENIVKSSVV